MRFSGYCGNDLSNDAIIGDVSDARWLRGRRASRTETAGVVDRPRIETTPSEANPRALTSVLARRCCERR
jgi:hypothetical protein